MANVNLNKGLRSGYNSIPTKSANDVYITTDTREGFLGGDQLWYSPDKIDNILRKSIGIMPIERYQGESVDISIGNSDTNIYIVSPNANCTISFIDPPSSGIVTTFEVHIQMGFPLYSVFWNNSIQWIGDEVPQFEDSNSYALTFRTLDGGVSYVGQLNYSYPYVYEYVTTNLQQHYDTLNNTGGGYNPTASTWKDLIGSNDATLSNTTWSSKSLQFNGIDAIGSFVGTMSWSYTIMGVFNRNLIQNSTNPLIYGFEGANYYPSLFLYTSQNLSYAIQGGGLNTYFNPATPMPSDVFQHIAITRSDADPIARLYVNGLQIATRTSSAGAQSVATAYIGGGANSFWGGEICNYMRYSRALTANEIMNNYLVDRDRYINF